MSMRTNSRHKDDRDAEEERTEKTRGRWESVQRGGVDEVVEHGRDYLG